MVYDFEEGDDRSAPTINENIQILDPNDLESIVILLELAAIELTPITGTQFSFEELFKMAREYGGSEDSISEENARIVLRDVKFLKKIGDKWILR